MKTAEILAVHMHYRRTWTSSLEV